MTLFVDASALVAMITNEPERDRFRQTVLAEADSLWSAMSCWETVSAVRKRGTLSVPEARALVEESAELLGLRLVDVGSTELIAALDAYQTYGRTSGHPAKLTMGDCFAYACAKANNASLLYKGNDFLHTDLA